MREKPLAVIILAAGKGTRMRSPLPKALHRVCGQPMIWHLVEKANVFSAKKPVVIAGHGIKLVRNFLGQNARVIWQKRLLGSGHAVNQAAGVFRGFRGSVLVLYCDTPLIKTETIDKLLRNHRATRTDCTMLSVRLQDPSGYGRVRRAADGLVERIIEHDDASPEEQAINEINVGCYVFDARKLFSALRLVRRDPKKKEYYLTDVIAVLAENGKVDSILAGDPEEARGINTRMDLSILQEAMQENLLKKWIEKGVEIRDPKTTTIDADVEIGIDTVILPHTVIQEGSRIGRGCSIGPFARIRGGSKIGDGTVVGNFVEVVRSKIGNKSYIKHLSYIGDAEVGSGVNVGAGTITANYDGKKKHKTVIKDGAQIGSGTVLVAPVTIGRFAKTGAGAVVTKGKNVPDKTVVVGVPARQLQKTD